MKLYTQSPLVVLCLFFTIITLFSCSKDSDLMADYIALDPEVLIGTYVKSDTYQISISPSPEDDTFEIIVNDESSDTDNRESSGTTVNDSYQISSTASIVLDVLANDTFNDLDNVSISDISQPDNGEVEINSDNTLTYTPLTIEPGEETFTYTTEFVKADATIGKETGTVTVVLNPITTSNSSSSSSQLLVDEGFESTAAWGTNGPFRPENNDATIVGNAREGNGCVRLTSAAGGNRSEFTTRRGSPDTYYEWGEEYWQGISIKVVTPVSGYKIALQHHAIPNGNNWENSAGSNSFTLTTDASTLTFWTSTDTNDVNKNPGNTAALGDQVGHSYPYNQNEWIDIVLHFRLAPDNTGFYEIWMNGTKVVNIQNNPTTYLYDTGNKTKYPFDYQKIGVYGGSGFTGEVHYDSFRVWRGPGGSYDLVRPRD